MLVFGVDVPLVELIFAMSIIIFILLIESVIIVFLLMRQSTKMKKVTGLVDKLSDTILAIKQAEIKELDALKGRKR